MEGGVRPRPPRILAARAAVGVVWLAVLGLALHALPGSVVAHEGPARLILEPDRVNPGGVVTVRGDDVGVEVELQLVLASATGDVELATLPTDPQGHLVTHVELPADLPTGTYALEARGGAAARVATASLVVEGSPILEGGEPGGKDEDDLLLIALPSDWQRSLSGPIVTARPLTETLPAGSAGRSGIEAIAVGLAIAVATVAIIIVVAGRIRRRTA